MLTTPKRSKDVHNHSQYTTDAGRPRLLEGSIVIRMPVLTDLSNLSPSGAVYLPGAQGLIQVKMSERVHSDTLASSVRLVRGRGGQFVEVDLLLYSDALAANTPANTSTLSCVPISELATGQIITWVSSADSSYLSAKAKAVKDRSADCGRPEYGDVELQSAFQSSANPGTVYVTASASTVPLVLQFYVRPKSSFEPTQIYVLSIGRGVVDAGGRSLNPSFEASVNFFALADDSAQVPFATVDRSGAVFVGKGTLRYDVDGDGHREQFMHTKAQSGEISLLASLVAIAGPRVADWTVVIPTARGIPVELSEPAAVGDRFVYPPEAWPPSRWAKSLFRTVVRRRMQMPWLRSVRAAPLE